MGQYVDNPMTRAGLAFLLGVAFLVGSVVLPASAAYLATVGWIFLLVIAPVFAIAERLNRDS
jgi:hypothetical protein